jgi:dihydroflavonol-4-reductase
MGGPVLVTGAGGFVGRHVVDALLGAGRTVRAFDLAFPQAMPEGVELVEGSILDRESLGPAAEGVSAIIHSAAIAHLWLREPASYLRVNVLGTEHVLDAAARAGVRMVHVSSFVTLVGQEAEDGAILDETVELPPAAMLGPYPRSKRLAELAVQRAAGDGIDTLMVLPSAPVGPGDWRMTPPSVMLRDLAAGATPALIDCLLNLVDVRALADGIVAALDHGRAGQRYLLTGEDIAMRDVAAIVARIAGVRAPRATVPMAIALAAAHVEGALSQLTGKPPKAPLTGVRLAARRVRFSNDKAARGLGFSPPPIEDAVRDAIGWMRQGGKLGQR